MPLALFKVGTVCVAEFGFRSLSEISLDSGELSISNTVRFELASKLSSGLPAHRLVCSLIRTGTMRDNYMARRTNQKFEVMGVIVGRHRRRGNLPVCCLMRKIG